MAKMIRNHDMPHARCRYSLSVRYDPQTYGVPYRFHEMMTKRKSFGKKPCPVRSGPPPLVRPQNRSDQRYTRSHADAN